MTRRLRVAASVVGLVAIGITGAPRSLAQDEHSARRVEAPPPAGPEIPAAVVAPDLRDDARQIAFHDGLDAAARAARIEAEIAAARRHAPFDLDWGLR